MDVAAFLAAIELDEQYDGQIVHRRKLPAREGQFAEPSRSLPKALAELLRGQGIEQLYSHQVLALETARAGQDCVVVTGTASGKTVSYTHLDVYKRQASQC